MKHFYHFYVEVNNMENIDLALDVEQIREIDQLWKQILANVKHELPEDYIDALTDKIYDEFFS